MTDGVTFKALFDELRRLEDCVKFFENRVLRQEIAIAEHLRLVLADPPPEQEVEIVRGRKKAVSDELMDATLEKFHGDYVLAARALMCSTENIYKRRPKHCATVTE